MTELTVDPYSHEFHEDPYVYYRELREKEPVYYNEERKCWLLTKWDDVSKALQDYETFSSIEGPALEPENASTFTQPMFIASDPPEHTRVRKIVSPLFTPPALKQYEPFIREKTLSLLEPHLATGKLDVIDDFAAYLPMAVVARMAGIPETDEDDVRRYVDDMIYREDKQFELSQTNIEAYFNLANYMEAFVEQQAAAQSRTEMLDVLLEAEQRGDMKRPEVVGFLMLLGIAGNETTTKLIGNMALRLWQHKDQRQLLVDDPAMIAKGVEETLRFDGSSQIIGRLATKDVAIRGKTIKKGDRVAMCIIAANRDEDHYERAEEYDVRRGAKGHIAFGYGIHACLGSSLARLETRIAFEELLPRMPNYEVQIDQARRAHNPNVRGFTHLPVTFTAAG